MPSPRSASGAATPSAGVANRRRSRRQRPPAGLGQDLETRPARVATYKRASTEEGNQPFSLEAQQMRLDAFLPTRPEWTVVAQYEERASAKDIDGRPQLLKLLDDAAAGAFDVVLVARLDRWSRSLIDVLDTVEELDESNVSLVSCTEQFNTRTAVGRLLLQLLGTFAEYERSSIIDRIQRGNRAKVRRGIPLTRRVGYGLTVDARGQVIPDAATIGVAERIIREYVAGTSGFRAIAEGLNEDGIPGPGGKKWSPQTVGNVLRNRGFVGEIKHRGEWLPGAHEPVIDLETYAAVEELLALRSVAGPSPSSLRGDYVLTGLITCARCQGAYVGTSGTSRSKTKVRYYSCGTARKYGAKTCGGPSLPAEELEGLVTEALLEVYRDNALFDEAITKHVAEQETRREPIERELASVNAALAGKERLLGRYRDDYEAERLSASRYEERSVELEAEVAALVARAADLEVSLGGTTVPVVPTEEQLAAMREHLVDGVRHGDLHARKELFNALVAGLEVHERDDIRPTFRVYDPHAVAVLNEARH